MIRAFQQARHVFDHLVPRVHIRDVRMFELQLEAKFENLNRTNKKLNNKLPSGQTVQPAAPVRQKRLSHTT